MPDHHNALPAGYRLGEYEIQTVLGSGGFGVTYKAYDHNLDKLVAIKEYLPPEFAVRDGRTTVKPKSSASKDDYAWGLDRFLDEARALARFDHPHINKVYRFFKENGTAYLVLEYVEGDMLSDLLKSKGRFNEAGVRRMLDELLDGLDKVHRAGYIHRDIKPANIIFRRDGSAVLLDFGAARQAIGQRSQMITSILTPGYAPVEQYLNTADAMGAWSDLYSLGVVAYRCLVGGDESVVIDAPSRAHYAQRGESEKDMPSAAEVGKGNYSDGLLKAIDWAMKVDERERPQSVGEMRAVLAGEGDVVATAPVVKKAKKKLSVKRTTKVTETQGVQPSQPPWVLFGSVIAFALALFGAVVLGVSQHQQRKAETIAEAERVEWRNVNCDNESAVRTYLQKYPDGRFRAEAYQCQVQIVVAARAATKRAAEAERQRKIAAALAEPSVYLVQRGDTICGIAQKFAVDCDELVNQMGTGGLIYPRQRLLIPSDLPAFRQKYKRMPSVRQVDSWGRTDLHIAADNGWAKLARWLIKRGADVNAHSNAYWTPLDYAILNDYDAMQSLLRQHGGRCIARCQ